MTIVGAMASDEGSIIRTQMHPRRRSPRLKGKDGRFLSGGCLDGSLSEVNHGRESASCYCGRKKRRIK